jgi:hypothetical protein
MEDNTLFKKLKKRLITFHITNEKVREQGLDDK